MADCTETLEELQRFLDNELPDTLLGSVTSHLGRCTDCQQAFEFHFELRRVIRHKALADDIPASLRAKIAACFGDDILGDASDE
jgi:mycothiol system anti-sigma-R factor